MSTQTEAAKKPWHCDECGKPLTDCPSGSVCPDGHGRIQPKMPPDVSRLNAARLAGVPELSIQPGALFELPGHTKKLTTGRKYTRAAAAVKEDRDYLVIVCGELRFFAKA